jgi:hypothetical protein
MAKKIAVLLLAAAAVLLLAGPADAAFRSLKANDGDQEDAWNNEDQNKPPLSPPVVTCGDASTIAPDTITVVVCPAQGEEAKHGFRLEWLTEAEFVANNGFGCNSTESSPELCAAKISGDSLDANGCATFVIGEPDLEDVRFKPPSCGDLTLACGETLVFRAFALGGRNRRTSEPSEPVSCSTEECFLCPEGESCQEVCEAPLVDVGCVEPCPPLSTGRNEAGSCICPSNFVYNPTTNECGCPGDLIPALPVPTTGPVCVCPPNSTPSTTCPDQCVLTPGVALVKCINTNPGQGSLCGACAPNCNSLENTAAICKLYYGTAVPDSCKVSAIGGGGQSSPCPQTFVCCAIKPDNEIMPTNPADPATCPSV